MKKRNVKKKEYNITEGAGINLEPPVRNERQREKAQASLQKPERRSAKAEALSKTEQRSRQNKKRRLKNKVRHILLSIALVALLLAVGVSLSLTVFFKIENVSVTGSGIYSESDVAAYSNIDVGDNLFLIDESRVNESITTNLPYIYNVEIKRELPSTVKLVLTDAVVKYSIETEEGYILLDDNFKVLETNAEALPAATTDIKDASVASAQAGYQIEFEDETTAQCLQALSSVINSLDMVEATSISSTDINHNYIVYEGRITFELGALDEETASRVLRGLAACEQLDESNPDSAGTLNLLSDKEVYFTAE